MCKGNIILKFWSIMSQKDNFPFSFNSLEEKNYLILGEKPTSYSDGINHKEIDDEIFNELNKKEKPKNKNKPGRKRRRENDNDNKKEHNKFSEDNIRRKIKSLFFKYIFIFINEKIKYMYNNDIGKGIFKKELRTINQSQTSNATIGFNEKLLNKKLEDICSVEITKKFTTYQSNQNNLVIKSLKKDEDENKREYFTKLFDLTFIDCLKHFRGDIKISELEGFTLFDNLEEIKSEYLIKYEDGEDYVKKLRDYLKDYENNIKGKKERKKMSNNEIVQNN